MLNHYTGKDVAQLANLFQESCKSFEDEPQSLNIQHLAVKQSPPPKNRDEMVPAPPSPGPPNPAPQNGTLPKPPPNIGPNKNAPIP